MRHSSLPRLSKALLAVAPAAFLAAFLAGGAAHAGTDCSNQDTDNRLPDLEPRDPVDFGRFTKPDAGFAQISIDPDGARTLPNELRTGASNGSGAILAGSMLVDGEAECHFTITVVSLPTDVVSVTLAQAENYAQFPNVRAPSPPLTAGGTVSGYFGSALDPSFTLLVGATLRVTPNTETVSGAIELRIDYTRP